jgi:hypothetical protein
MATRRAVTVMVTTWTIRWWDGTAWIEHTLRPRVEVVSAGEATDTPELAGGVAPQPPARVSGVEQEADNERKGTA